MGVRKLIDLGGGLSRKVSYEELKSLLGKSATDPISTDKALRHAFPDEFAAENEANHAKKWSQLDEKRWKSYLCETPSNPKLEPYRYSHQDVVRRVSKHQLDHTKNHPQNRVTDFTNWIFEAIYGRSDATSKQNGKDGEREVARIKRLLRPSHVHSDWQLIDRDPLQGTPKSREISLLKVGNDSLFGAPDYVFHSRTEDTILIIEVKVSNHAFPSDGWPNLRAQLWAYGNIDDYINRAKKIALIGEIWRKRFDIAVGEQTFYLGATYRREMSDTEFCSQNEEIFEIYQTAVHNARANL